MFGPFTKQKEVKHTVNHREEDNTLTVTVQQKTSMYERKLTKSIPWNLKVPHKAALPWRHFSIQCNCTWSLPCVGTLPVPLSQYAQLPTPLAGPLTDPGAQRLQREGLSVNPGPHASFSGGQHRRRKRRGGSHPGQSGRRNIKNLLPSMVKTGESFLGYGIRIRCTYRHR